jgi:hypothetical protein
MENSMEKVSTTQKIGPKEECGTTASIVDRFLFN